MATEAKRASNARYLSQFKTISIRMKHAEMDQLTAAASAAGESVAGFITEACRRRMAGQGEMVGGGILSAAAEEIARAAADRAGLEPEVWVTAAVQEQSARDARAEELRRLLANKEKK